MQRFGRGVARLLFLTLSFALIYGIIAFPPEASASLYDRTIAPLSQPVTPTASALSAPADAPAHTAPEIPVDDPTPQPLKGTVMALMYHHLSENLEETGPWTATPEKFREDLLAYLAAGYQPLSLEDYVRGDYDPFTDYFVITFDDGYESNLTLGLPILTELSVPATVFVITGGVGSPGRMSWEQIGELTASGLVTVYSHTDSHIAETELGTEAFLSDEAVAQEKLSEHLSLPYKVLSYPFGVYTKDSLLALRETYDLFVIQDMPWWYKEEGGAKLMIRRNVEQTTKPQNTLENHRYIWGLPSLAESAAQRAAYEEWYKAARAAWAAHIKKG